MDNQHIEVDKETLQFTRAVKDIDQAYSICKRLIFNNQRRMQKDAAIQRKMNDEQPWDGKRLKAAGQGWRHNRATGFMPSIVRRVTPPYKKSIDGARVLTSSQLKESTQDAEKKSKAFQVETTKTIRRWNSWGDFCDMMIMEDVVIGRAAINWSDEFEWTPTLCRSDDALFPDGCPQTAKDVPLWMRRQNFLVHELAVKLKEPDISESVGWNIKNVVTAINDAKPPNRESRIDETLRQYEDTIRESTMGYSYSEGVDVIETYHLFVQEGTGKVSHYLLNAKSGKELFVRYDRFDSMDECLALFALEVGNGKIHGSKGVGRILYNTHVAVEQSRNLIADSLYLAGLLLLKATQRGKEMAAITVTHPVCVIGEGYDVAEVKFNPNVDAFFSLDQHMTRLAELQVGAFMPQIGPDAPQRKASEINYLASIEMEIREGVVARFWNQFMLMIWQMQKRIYSNENIAIAYDLYRAKKQTAAIQIPRKMWDLMVRIGRKMFGMAPVKEEVAYSNKEAVDACVTLMDQGLTPEEIHELAHSNPAEIIHDFTAQTMQAMDAVTARYLNDPMIRQQELKKRDIASKMGHSVADQLVIPEEDGTVSAESIRMQIIEDSELLQGNVVPVSPRDDHALHMKVMMEKTKELMGSVTPESVTKESLAIMDTLLQHFDAHLQGAMGKGGDSKTLAEPMMFSKVAHALIQKAQAAFSGQPQAGLQVPQGVVPASAALQAQADGSGLERLGSSVAETPAIPPKAPAPKPNVALSRGPVDLTPKVSP